MKRKLSNLIAAVFIGIGAFSCICQAAGMDIDKEDGEYSIQVDLEGGSGKASVTSPTILRRMVRLTHRSSGAVQIMII